MLIYGAQDPRCPPRQVEQYADALRSLGKPVRALSHGGGHGVHAASAAADHVDAQISFAVAHSGPVRPAGQRERLPAAGNDARWLIRHHRTPCGRIPLYCLPHAGGAASAYRTWAAAMTDVADVAAVQLPGRESRIAEPPSVDPAAIAEAILRDSTGPAALFGHSMGAVVAFEVAVELTRRGRGPLRLFVAGSSGPGNLPPIEMPCWEPPYSGLVSWLHNAGGTSAAALDDPELLALALPALRADLEWLSAYVPSSSPRLACPVTAFIGSGDPGGAHAERWADWTDGPFSLCELPGAHFIHFEQRDRVLARIRGDLDIARW
jgi:surfactin synthase thioesterase subunit